MSCGYDYSGLAGCEKDMLSDSCSYWRVYGNTHCNYPPKDISKVFKKFGGTDGVKSRCWKTNVIEQSIGKKGLNALCFESTCDHSN